MCGASNGVIGYEKNSVLRKLVYGEKNAFGLDDHAPMMINAVLLDFDDVSFQCTRLELLNQGVER